MMNTSDMVHNRNDESWERALQVSREALKIPSVLPTLVKNSWSGNYTVNDFMHGIGFPGWSPRSLLWAAKLGALEGGGSVADIKRAVARLGVSSAATVVAVNFVCCAALIGKPSQKLWLPVFRDLMTGVEIGHCFGSTADGVGPDGGMVIGLAQNVGLVVLLAHNLEIFTTWHNKTNGVCTPKLCRELFGCEPYQVGALTLQQLGFGPEMALAAAISNSLFGKELQVIDASHATTKWKAAFKWVEALLGGASFPVDTDARSMFNEQLGVQEDGELNEQLLQFYTRVAEIRRDRSAWIWHLPKGSYEETIIHLEGVPAASPAATTVQKAPRKPAGYQTYKRQVSMQD
jgi:hypothetical protein